MNRAFCFVVAFAILGGVARGQTHRVVVDVTLQHCNAFSCRQFRTSVEGSGVAVGRLNGSEYILTNRHLFQGEQVLSNGMKESIVRVHGVVLKTSDAGDFPAVYIDGRDSKGEDGVDLAVLRVESPRAWLSYPIAAENPPRGTPVTIRGYPRGQWSNRGSNVEGYSTAWGMLCTGEAQGGASGGSVVSEGKLVGIVWGSRVGNQTGTFATPAAEVAKFVRGALGSIPEATGEARGIADATPPTRTPDRVQFGDNRPTVGPRANQVCCNCSESMRTLRAELNALSVRLEAASKPADLSGIVSELSALSKRLEQLEQKPPADLSGLEERVAELRGLSLPVRIETSDGKQIATRRLQIVAGESGLEFRPLVLQFDERILTGDGSK